MILLIFTYAVSVGRRTVCLYGYGRTIDGYMTVTVSPYTVCLVRMARSARIDFVLRCPFSSAWINFIIIGFPFSVTVTVHMDNSNGQNALKYGPIIHTSLLQLTCENPTSNTIFIILIYVLKY